MPKAVELSDGSEVANSIRSRRRFAWNRFSTGWRLFCGMLLLLLERPAAADTNVPARFDVLAYVVKGSLPFPATNLDTFFSPPAGTNVDLEQIVRAAADLQSVCARHGQPQTGIAFAPEQIANGIVTLHVFQSAVPQIVVSGRPWFVFSNLVGAVNMTGLVTNGPPAPAAGTGAVRPPSPNVRPLPPATPAELARARAALLQTLAEAAAAEEDTRIHVACTNAGPRFDVERYLIMGNSILPPAVLAETLTNIDGAFGTNVCFDGIRTAVEQLQKAYRDRGYLTVAVGLPQQKLTNATVKIQVTEGRLATVEVTGNRWFSVDNVRRALPSLHTNMVLNGLVFQAELNQANANQDRQIYPVIGPGPDPGTSALTLRVRDRLPLHAKLEFNNEGSPGTPSLRVNASLAYNNLWQREHSFGAQYGFSPEAYKQGSLWNSWSFYDEPVVAYYSGYYRLPLGSSPPLADRISSNPTRFGYNEATRQFNLPPPTGRPELTLYASRSTVDTGVQSLSSFEFLNEGGFLVGDSQTFQQDVTVNQTLGLLLDRPLPETHGINSTFSAGLNFKTYGLDLYRTNVTTLLQTVPKPGGGTATTTQHFPSPTVVAESLEYLPLTLHYDGTWRGPAGRLTLSLGISGNAWYSGSEANLRNVAGSPKATGHWLTLTPSLFWDVPLRGQWDLLLHASGQWASEPLISNEQFGAGGVNSVRGYREGEVFGDEGWRVSAEQQTAPYQVGLVYGDTPLVVRASIYMDYARVLLIDPQGRPGAVGLWGTGFGVTASVGSHWDARLLFSLPLMSAGTTDALQPCFNFSLTAQF